MPDAKKKTVKIVSAFMSDAQKGKEKGAQPLPNVKFTPRHTSKNATTGTPTLIIHENREADYFAGKNSQLSYSSTQPMTEEEYWDDLEGRLDEEGRMDGVDRRDIDAARRPDGPRARALELASLGFESDPDGDEQVNRVLQAIGRADRRNDVISRALDEFEAGASLTGYWKRHRDSWNGQDYQVLQQLRGMYIRNNIPCGGALGSAELFEMTELANGFKQKRAVEMTVLRVFSFESNSLLYVCTTRHTQYRTLKNGS